MNLREHKLQIVLELFLDGNGYDEIYFSRKMDTKSSLRIRDLPYNLVYFILDLLFHLIRNWNN